MSNWEKNVRKVVPYVPGEQPHEADMIKLNTNENPYPPSPKAAEAIRRVAEEDTLRLYPDPTAAELVQAIADVYHVSQKQVFVGVGSDDVLAMAFMTYFNSDKPILFRTLRIPSTMSGRRNSAFRTSRFRSMKISALCRSSILQRTIQMAELCSRTRMHRRVWSFRFLRSNRYYRTTRMWL